MKSSDDDHFCSGCQNIMQYPAKESFSGLHLLLNLVDAKLSNAMSIKITTFRKGSTKLTQAN